MPAGVAARAEGRGTVGHHAGRSRRGWRFVGRTRIDEAAAGEIGKAAIGNALRRHAQRRRPPPHDRRATTDVR
ncbi:hypothetical protein WS73_04205 [Burkholderia savannae]|nr:hypothetical protein WS73_04205 [Burkholderia savannae]